MKRILTLTLCFLMLMSLFAGCGESKQEAGGGSFMVGFAAADITPKEPVTMWGYRNEDQIGTFEYAVEALQVTVGAFTDTEGNTLILMATDLLGMKAVVGDKIRQQISEETGVPFDHIMFTASHNHYGPNVTDAKYSQLLQTQCVSAAKAAMEDRKPATMEHTFTRVDDPIVTVRHYLVADGTYKGLRTWNGVTPAEFIGHFTRADNLMQMVRFNREGAKPVVLIGWQGHPSGRVTDVTGSYNVASWAYPGVMRKTVEEALDCHGMYILSGTGNLVTSSKIPEEDKNGTYLEFGKVLGDIAVESAKNFKPANTGTIQVVTKYLDMKGNEAEVGTPIYAASMGDLAIPFAPFEIFDTNAVNVRNNSKFPITMYASCSNDYQSYLPTKDTFPNMIYEVQVTTYPAGTAENLEAMHIRMLDELFATSGLTEQTKPDGYITPVFEPCSDGVTYINPYPGDVTRVKPVQNGYYQFTLIKNDMPRIMLANDLNLAMQIIAKESMQLIFDEQGAIVGIVE